MEGFKVVEKAPNIVWVSKEKIEDRIDCNPYKVEYIGNEQVLKQKLPYKTIEQLLRSRKDLTGGATPLGANYLSDGVRFIRTQNVERNCINLKDVVYISEEDNKKLTRSILEENDILVTITGADFGRISPVTKECLPANINQHSVRIHFKEDIDPHYVSVFLNSLYGQSQIFRYSIGATRPAIDYTAIKNINIPIPSPEIQKYIGDKVRKAEKLRKESNNLNLLCENEIKKVLNLSEGEGLYNNNAGNKSLEYNDYPIKSYVNPRNITNRLDPQSYHPELYETLEKIESLNCRSMKLKELLENYSTGKSSPKYADKGFQILMTKNIKNNTIDWDCKKVEENYINQSDMVNKEELLITTYGGPSIGKVDILFEEKLCTFDYTILKIKFNESCNPYFMTMILRSKFVQNQIRYLIKGTTGITFVIPNEILDINIPIINKETQDKIGEVYKKSLDNIKTSKILMQQAKKDIEDLIEGNFDMSKINEN